MAADLQALVPEFREKVEQLIDNCLRQDIAMRPYFAVRTPFEQAKLWRQSRTREEIDDKISSLLAAGCDFLAHCIESVGPQHGAHVTNAPPGLSWHQWAESVDCMWVVGRAAEWSTTRKVAGVNGYRLYAEEARKLNLFAGGLWKTFKDWPHVQLRAAGSPDKVMALKDIDAEMRSRFG